MKNTWQLQQAKSEFCAVAEKAARGRPQVVTKHGRPFVIIASVKDWESTGPKQKTLLEALRACPSDLSTVMPERSRELPRSVAL
ncbi:MAG: type II toxin-antitoxin system prevent-host-death family antitoxin [Opitutaceae bacterium]|nr:type II toxin-antitoxin system prevent-host-death family antitoxin [Opitutaceae bacterium]